MFEGKKQILYALLGGIILAQLAQSVSTAGGFFSRTSERTGQPISVLLGIGAAIYLAWFKPPAGGTRSTLLGIVAAAGAGFWAARRGGGTATLKGVDDDEPSNVIDIDSSSPSGTAPARGEEEEAYY